MEYQHARHYTLEEARAALTEIVPMIETIQEKKARLDEMGYDIRGHHFFAGMGMNGTKAYPDEVDQLIDVFRDVTSQGVVIKDMVRGLIDFPAIRSTGEEVYLCYLLGEPTIEYFHGIEDGFAGRERVENL